MLKNNDVDKELCNIFPIRSKEDLLRLQDQLNDYDETKLQSVVKKNYKQRRNFKKPTQFTGRRHNQRLQLRLCPKQGGAQKLLQS